MKKTLAFLALALGSFSVAGADRKLVAHGFDIDSLSYMYPKLTEQRADNRLVTTSGSSSATLTSVNSDAPFEAISVGDVLLLQDTDATTGARTGTVLRYVTAKASANSITLNDSVLIAAAGQGFSWLKASSGTGAEDGWIGLGAAIALNTIVDIDQISVTGGVDIALECRHCAQQYGGSSPSLCTGAMVVDGPDNKTTAGTYQLAWSLSGAGQGPWDQCRVGVKIGTADDDVLTIASGSNDDLDWKEFVNSYTVGAANKIDFVEDAGGTPNVCVAALTAGSYTGATLAVEIATQMNAAACSVNNTYNASYSTSTHKFTIIRAAGTDTIDLLWQTGTNTATSAKTVLGYSNTDDTGATSYASDSATGETTFTAALTAGLYATGDAMCTEIATDMNATTSVTATYACSYSSATDEITISATGIDELMLLWSTGSNTATSAKTTLGFDNTDDTGALTYTSDNALGLDASNEIEIINIGFASVE